MEPVEKNKGGRPTLYSQELADYICERLATGESMRKISRDEDMPCMSTMFKWLRENKEFSQQYARAKEESADALFEETVDLADDALTLAQESGDPKLAGSLVQAQRLRVDTRKWMMSKMKPKKYGDAIDVTSGGDKIAVLPQEIYAKRNTPSSPS